MRTLLDSLPKIKTVKLDVAGCSHEVSVNSSEEVPELQVKTIICEIFNKAFFRQEQDQQRASTNSPSIHFKSDLFFVLTIISQFLFLRILPPERQSSLNMQFLWRFGTNSELSTQPQSRLFAFIGIYFTFY